MEYLIKRDASGLFVQIPIEENDDESSEIENKEDVRRIETSKVPESPRNANSVYKSPKIEEIKASKSAESTKNVEISKQIKRI